MPCEAKLQVREIYVKKERKKRKRTDIRNSDDQKARSGYDLS